MTLEPCSMAPLVEARRDGRLDDHDAGSVDRHIKACRSCAALARDLARLAELARLPIAPATQLERRRGRIRLLRTEALPVVPRRRRPWLAAGIALAAALAVIVMTGSPARSVPFLARLPSLPTAGLVRTETTVTGMDGAHFERSVADGVEIVALKAGTIRLAVRPLAAGERLLVRTMDAEVEVRGTVFDVEAGEGRIRAVRVTEGTVEVRYQGERTLVGAGGTWHPPSVAGAPAIETSAPVPAAPAKRSRAPVRGERDNVSLAFDEGVHMIERGDYAAATAKLQEFQTANPADARAEDAAFLVVIALQRVGRRADAAEAARMYLARYPNGYRRREAEAMARDR